MNDTFREFNTKNSFEFSNSATTIQVNVVDKKTISSREKKILNSINLNACHETDKNYHTVN